ncbi:putative sulfate transporter family protein [Zalerion maritima]|uniref:Sulfate transporter family protein n=1 Tax=Zalerion maritima TaxID=339359 RepID=A0AAD5RX86_9PEZI|nr:putative sulfate transporter family protein [Zalerion maritima]
MSSSLRKMLNSNRVRKRPAAQSSPRRAASSSSNTSASAAAAAGSTAKDRDASSAATPDPDDISLGFDDSCPLPDLGLVGAVDVNVDVGATNTVAESSSNSNSALPGASAMQRGVPSAISFAAAHRWDPLPTPEGARTLSATSARAQSFRRQLPGMASAGCVGCVLGVGLGIGAGASGPGSRGAGGGGGRGRGRGQGGSEIITPAALEREIAELRANGTIRKVEIPRKRRGQGRGAGMGGTGTTGGVGVNMRRRRNEGGNAEGLIMMSELEKLVREKVSPETAEAWGGWLRVNPMALSVTVGTGSGSGSGFSGEKEGAHAPSPAITTAQADELVRKGFLTADHGDGMIDVEEIYGNRAADRGTLLSMAAVGRGLTAEEAGVPGVDPTTALATASAARKSIMHAEEVLRIAVPGHGTLLRISDAAVDRLVQLLGKTQHREAPESLLRERWDGGSVNGDRVAGWKQKRHGRTVANPGTMPHRTRKWKEFYGLGFDLVLLEAVGEGTVEVFDTGSVGRGVRLVA